MTDMALNRLTIAAARDQLRSGETTSLKLTEACLDAVTEAGALNATCHGDKTAAKAIEMAEAADARRAAGETHDLLGIPIAVKDLFCTEGVGSQAASNILSGFLPTYESTVTSNLWAKGAVMACKTSMDEFAMGSSTETSCYGPAISPWRRAGDTAPITPGGSSGGSSAAVAADLALAALGTDTGGSIRQPAALTGTVGLKPTYGRCSRWGIVAFASSLDQAGPMTKTVRDAAILLGGMAGHDLKDSTSADLAVPDFEAALDQGVAGKRIGIPAEYREGCPAETAKYWDDGITMMRDAGAQIVDISLPHTKYALPAYYIIAPAEASSNLARYDGVRYGRRAALDAGDGVTELYEKTRAQGFGAEVRRRVLIGTYVLSAGYYDAYYLRAQKVRRLILKDFEDAWASCDAILTPTTPDPGFALGEVSDPLSMYLQDVYTVTVNLAGLPGISVPVGLSASGLPLGLQLIGQPWGEGDLLAAAQVLEDRAGFSAKPERWW
ncbi:MAG: Asp-tRNA(Asn)/Glu-tRNA(Gln) amidotransferase subunit GatA [Pseudomonadota bacterium]